MEYSAPNGASKSHASPPQASGVIMAEGAEDQQVPEGADIYSRTVSAYHGRAIAHMNS